MAASHAMKKYQTGGYVAPDYAQQPAPAQPHIRIAPPQMSAHQQAVMADAMNAPSRNWGEALSKIANVFVTGRNNEREAENKRQHLNDQEQRRGVWAQQLHSGATLRDIASIDPGVMSDSSFLDFAKTTTPAVAAEVELFEDVDSPYGKGGFGQRSSTTGKIVGYQTAPTAPTAPQRRIVKGQDGANYFADTQERVLPGVAAPTPDAEAEPISFDTQSKARKEWKAESGVFNKTQDAFRRVVSSADRATAAGDLAMVFNFMKTLDPGSVVRESEFATAQNSAGIPDRLRAKYNRLLRGERLAPDQRQDFLTTASDLYLGQVDQQQRKRGQYEQAYRASGLDPSRTLVDYIDRDLVKRFAQQDAPQGGVATAPQPPMAQTPSSLFSQANAAPAAASQPATTGTAPDAARIRMYAQLKPEQLKRQVQTIAADPDNYSDEEKRAAAVAWDAAFGGGQ